MATTDEIAQWMFEAYEVRDGRLAQSFAAHQIKKLFGEENTYRNRIGDLDINKPILDKFWQLTGGDTVWSRSEQQWRKRRRSDPPGRKVR